ncbi:MAG: heavy metal-binding domain-containing protein [Verrucomicrobiota bacterium]
MKKFKSVMAAFALLSLAGAAAFVVGCKHTESSERGSGHVHTYTCTHHPEVVQDSPGTCPKCGMKLVHKD